MKTKEPTVHCNVRMPPSDIDMLNRVAERENVTISDVVRHAISETAKKEGWHEQD